MSMELTLSAVVIMALLFLSLVCIDFTLLVSGCMVFWEFKLFWSCKFSIRSATRLL
jgi:hypothetical protein